MSSNSPSKNPNNLQKKDTQAERLTTLTGKLRLDFYEHFHEDPSTKSYYETTPYWFIELDQPSLLLTLNLPEDEFTPKLETLLKEEKPNKMMLISIHDLSNFYKTYKDQQIAVKGTIFYAHRSCHRTFTCMDVEQISVYINS
ncbi:MAG: hypothetical protein ACOYMJ_05080 [Candidatus Methylopumilus universalis]